MESTIYSDGKYLTAIGHFNRVIALDSANPKAYYYKALTFMEGSRADYGSNISDSIELSFANTLKLDSGFYPMAYRYLAGLAYFHLNEEALSLIKKAIQQNPSDFETLLLSVRIKYSFQDLSIMDDLNRLIDLQPKRFRPYYLRGQYLFYNAGKPEKAYRDFRKALKYATDEDLQNFKSFYFTYYHILKRTKRSAKMKRLKRQHLVAEDADIKMEKYQYKIFEFK